MSAPRADAAWIADLWRAQPWWERAPSAHNTQPWTLHVDGARVHLGWEADRTLPVTDATGRDLRLSLGCLAEAVRLVLADPAHGGHDVGVRWRWQEGERRAATFERLGESGPVRAVDAGSDLAGRATPDASRAPGGLGISGFSGAVARPGAREFTATAAEVAARRTHRGDYRTAPRAERALAALNPAFASCGPPTSGLVALDADRARRWLGEADRAQFADPAAAAELARWLRWRPADDGLGHEALLAPAWQVRALARVLTGSGHWIGHRVGRRIGVPGALAVASAPRHLGVVLVAHAPAGVGPQEQCELGRGLLRAWLVAAREGWAVHPLSQLIDVPTTAARVRALLPDGHEAVAIFRLGHPPTPAPHSPRRPLTRPKAALSAEG